MTVPSTETATGAPVSEAQEKVVEKTEEHTPNPPLNPEPVHHTADDGLAEVKESIASLASTVATLTDFVTKNVAHKDEAPKSIPWTHRGSAHDSEHH